MCRSSRRQVSDRMVSLVAITPRPEPYEMLRTEICFSTALLGLLWRPKSRSNGTDARASEDTRARRECSTDSNSPEDSSRDRAAWRARSYYSFAPFSSSNCDDSILFSTTWEGRGDLLLVRFNFTVSILPSILLFFNGLRVWLGVLRNMEILKKNQFILR